MQPADLEEVMGIEQHAFRSPWSRQIFSEELDREWAYLDVLRERQRDGSSRIAAYCNYWLVRDEVHLLNIATHPEVRRRGHARALMTHMIDFARRHRCRLADGLDIFIDAPAPLPLHHPRGAPLEPAGHRPLPRVRLPAGRHPAQVLRRGPGGRGGDAARAQNGLIRTGATGSGLAP